jgi:hypothetical protein
LVDADLGLDCAFKVSLEVNSNGTAGEDASLRIQLGISPRTGASLAELYERAQENTQLAVAASKDLRHLSEADFVRHCPLVVEDDMYVLVIPIEPAPQLVMDLGGKRNKAAYVRARDTTLQAAIDLTTEGVLAGADLLRVVAATTDTSPNARRELRHLELEKGVDTKPARKFLFQKREAFLATVETTSALFEGQAVRPSQQVSDPVRVLARLVPHASKTSFENCIVRESPPTLEGITSGGRKEFRFADLEPWQRVALAGAREAETEFWLEAVSRIGTCSLEYRPADVERVEDWSRLHAAALALLQAVTFPRSLEGQP